MEAGAVDEERIVCQDGGEHGGSHTGNDIVTKSARVRAHCAVKI